jgi:hypothetical protein
MRPLSDRQTVEAALEVWAAAERQQLGVVADDNSVIELLYASVQIQAPDVAASLTEAAILKLVNRIQIELTRRAALSELGSAESLIAKLPSLGRFAVTGKLGHLREEWEQLTHRNAEASSRIAAERHRVFNEFKNLMPAMPYETHDDGTIVYRYDFGSPELQESLKANLAEIDQYQLNKRGFYQSFMADLPRTFFSIEIDGAKHRFDLGLEKEKLEMLKKAFDKNPLVLPTVSKVLCQAMPAIVLTMNQTLFPNLSSVVLKANQANSERTHFQVRCNGDKIELGCNVYAKVDKVALPATSDGRQDQIWPANQGAKWSGAPGPTNYGRLIHFNFTLDTAAAARGELRAVEGSAIQAYTETRLCPATSHQRS